jgi:hypothetical protein
VIDTEVVSTNLMAWPDGVRFFNYTGSRHRIWWLKVLPRTEWRTNGSGTLQPRRPTSLRPRLRRLIADVVAAGKEPQLTMLRVNAYNAVIMYLEGLITLDHVRRATEHNDYIDIPGVVIDDRCLVVRIMPQEMIMYASDRAGNKLVD